MIGLDADVDDYELTDVASVDMDFFDGTPLPKGTSVSVSHSIEWGRQTGGRTFDYHYNFFDYAFTRGDVVVRCRYYWDSDREISIGFPQRRQSEGLPESVEDETLMRVAVRYFVEREFRTIKVMDVNGYVRLKPEHPYMQAARA